jgi:Tfp pilus assembly protein PilN
MIRVNLLAPGTEPSARAWYHWFAVPPEQRAALLGLAMLMATAIGVGTWWYLIDSERQAVDVEIAVGESTLTRLQEAAKLMERETTRAKDLGERLSLIERLRASQRAPVELLDTISRALAEGLWRTELKQTGATVQLDGRAVSLAAVTDFIDQLQLSGRFVRAIDIVTTGVETLVGVQVVKFTIRGEVASLAPPLVDEDEAPGTPAKGGQ